MAMIHFILQGKGGVGKSLIAALLAQYLQGRNLGVHCFDTDPINATLVGYEALDAVALDIMNPRSRFTTGHGSCAGSSRHWALAVVSNPSTPWRPGSAPTPATGSPTCGVPWSTRSISLTCFPWPASGRGEATAPVRSTRRTRRRLWSAPPTDRRRFGSIFMAGSAKGQMRQWYEANNPFDRAKEGKLVQVSIKGLPLPVSQDSWRVEWTETVRGHTGAVLVDPQTFEATLTVQLQPPATDAQVMRNPGGIAITGLSFSRVLSGGSDK